MLGLQLAKKFIRSLSRPSTCRSAIDTSYALPYNLFALDNYTKPMSAVASKAGGASNPSSSSESSPRPRLLASISEAPEHHFDDHVERPARIQGIVQALASSGFLNPASINNPASSSSNTPLSISGIETPLDGRLASQISLIPPRRVATMEEIALIHKYGETLKNNSSLATPKAPLAVADLGDPDGVTYVTESSFQDALIAVGTSLQLVDDIVNASRTAKTPTSPVKDPSNTPSGFAVIRPPGHHATPDTALGYCLFNNVAIAAKYAQKMHRLHNVLILDFDVHNGNGTCQAYWEDPTVMVIDVHEENMVYPTPEFIPHGVEDIGGGAGEGLTINVPLPRYAGHQCMHMTMESVVIPAARRFKPDIILISAGYDAHVADPFQVLQFQSGTYYDIAKQMRELADELCNGRIAFLLEGGYDVEALGESVVETWLALVGEPSREGAHLKELHQEEPVEEVQQLLQKVKRVHRLL